MTATETIETVVAKEDARLADAGETKGRGRKLTKFRFSDIHFSKTTLDSFWILMNYGVTAGSGMLFWVFAAKVIPPEALGIETAILSIITAASSVAAIGAGNAILSMLPASGSAARGLLNYAVQSVVALSLFTGLIAGVLVAAFIPTGTPAFIVIPVITVATMFWALFVFKDSTFGGLNQIREALGVNGIANVVKLGLLIVLGNLLASAFRPLLAASAIPIVAAVVIWFAVLVPRMLKNDKREVQGDVVAPVTPADAYRWLAETRKPFRHYTLRDSLSTSLNLGIGMSLSFIVAATAGAEAGAVFAICYQVAAILDLVVVGATGSLILNNTSGHIDARKLALTMWLRAFALVAFVAICISVFSSTILNFLNPFYVQNNGVAVLILLMSGSVLRTAYEVWSSLMRAQHRTLAILKVNSVTGVLLLGGTVLGSMMYGAVGCAVAVVALTLVQAAIGITGILRSKREALS